MLNGQEDPSKRKTLNGELKDVDYCQSGKFTFAPKGRMTANAQEPNIENGGVSFGATTALHE